MKLQIMSRLSQHNHFKIDSLTSCKPEARDSKLISSRNLLADDIDQYISTLIHKRPKQESKNESLRLFFLNFQTKCQVEYKSVAPREVNVRKKLQRQLFLLAAKQKENIQKQPISTFTFAERELTREVRGYESMPTEPCRNQSSQQYYVVQQKPKQKIRKFNSLISIRSNDQTQQEQRKPGFILKRNVSLCNKQRVQLGNRQPVDNRVEDNLAKGSKTRRDHHKHKWDRVDKVDEEISQSKERIARIRKQLNQIYQNSRGPNAYKLKLF